MKDKRPHIKPDELAGLIRQYLAGELDDKAMHALERQALNDPFLADAIEGYAGHTPEQTVHQQELASRLSDRIATRTGRVRPMYYRWAAAAAILLLMFSAGWFLWEQQRKAPIAGVNVPQPTPQASPVYSEHGDTAPGKVQDETIHQAEADQNAATAKNDQLAQNTLPPAPVREKTQQSNVVREQESNSVLSEAAADKAAPAAYEKSAATDTIGAAAASRQQQLLKEDASRKVIAPAQPRLKEDASRNFNVQPATGKPAPAFADRRQQQSILLNPPDSQKSHLNEVVVVGYGAQKKKDVTGSVVVIRGQSGINPPASGVDSQLQGRTAGVSVESSANTTIGEDMAYREPAPVTGFTAFENYLKTKTINPDNKYNGTVRVSFIVMPDGSLQDFKILRHLNEACDAEAIRVIKEGPAWAPASDRKPTRVKVRVKFTVEKNK